MTYTTLAEEYRAGVLENAHQGLICIVDEKKNVVYSKGDTGEPILYRSAMKPLQAIPVFTSNVIRNYQLTTKEMALFTASQRGETYQQKSLESLITKLDLLEETLICGKSYPLNEVPKINHICNNMPKRKLLHNCAGKHLGFLAYCREHGYPLSSYGKIEHPLQQRILQDVAELAEISKEKIVTAVDGCGVPVHAVPIKNMAISYLKFAVPDLINDITTANAVVNITNTMNAHPEIVASHNFICTTLLKDNNIVAKGGAQGVYCLALKEEKLSIAIKVLSGTELLWPLLVARALEKIGYKNQETIDNLLLIRSKDILNDDGDIVGETKILF
ncbi:asparaginase (plasmid) [Alkalihalophilus pseudofirmus]|uniref:asparaginase n=1 Tax=Alkalihalophilus pseudofirmus TaxID=79885 RepID=UPI00259B4E82|nr:asparaginase [Alkalihalophilus pseudofirmus]WEG19216.1 asparaginase [Alkalihalophilus pseudofirmus]